MNVLQWKCLNQCLISLFEQCTIFMLVVIVKKQKKNCWNCRDVNTGLPCQILLFVKKKKWKKENAIYHFVTMHHYSLAYFNFKIPQIKMEHTMHIFCISRVVTSHFVNDIKKIVFRKCSVLGIFCQCFSCVVLICKGICFCSVLLFF